VIDNFGGCTVDNMVRNDEVVGSIPTSSTISTTEDRIAFLEKRPAQRLLF
jgi:hypothetical protein